MRICVLVCLLAGCPKGGAGGTGPAVQLGVGCPSASAVHVASYLSPEEGGKGHTGWVLPLHDKVVESVKDAPEYAPVDPAAASAAGVPAPPQHVWMLGGAQACKATVGGYYAAAIDSPTPNIAYGVELSGCPAPPDPQNASAIVVVSESPPHECQIVPPRGVAGRLGEMDKQGVWQRPVKETAIPEVIAKVIPTKPCALPTCELWSIAQVDVAVGRS
jgi:hypothetical protein